MLKLTDLAPGAEYARLVLHASGLGGELQRGISYAADGTYALLFSDPEDRSFGYSDGWVDDQRRVYRYSGMWYGPGAMTLTRGNAAVLARSPELYLFVRSGQRYQFQGRFECIDTEQVTALNRGVSARALVFVLRRVDDVEARAPEDSAVSRGLQRRLVQHGRPSMLRESSFVDVLDPEQRRTRLEKALGGHQAIVEILDDIFRDADASVHEDPESYDLLVEWSDGISLLIEAKTLPEWPLDRLRLGGRSAARVRLPCRTRVRHTAQACPGPRCRASSADLAYGVSRRAARNQSLDPA